MTYSLFDEPSQSARKEFLSDGIVLLHRFAQDVGNALLADIQDICTQAPFRHMRTPGGRQLSVANTSCGKCGWISDVHGYRYSDIDLISGKHWPDMPDSLMTLATSAAREANYSDFQPDSCLINRYQAGTGLSLHQDIDERDFQQPIVSVSLGMSATFLLGGSQRKDKTRKLLLEHGDVLVWGGVARKIFHGIAPLKEGSHPVLGKQRINLTFRRAR